MIASELRLQVRDVLRLLQPSTFGAIGCLAMSSFSLQTVLQALRDLLPLRITIAELGRLIVC